MNKEIRDNKGELKTFHLALQINRMVIFEVNYYRLSDNKNKYFTTSACVFTRNKKSYTNCGQCQDSVLIGYSKRFYEKWDIHHLKDLTEELYIELMKDVEKLKSLYNFIEDNRDNYNFGIYELKELSMLKEKSKIKK